MRTHTKRGRKSWVGGAPSTGGRNSTIVQTQAVATPQPAAAVPTLLNSRIIHPVHLRLLKVGTPL